MKLEIQHIEIHVSSLDNARQFYVDALGLDILEEVPAINLLSVRAGGVRISIFGGFKQKKQMVHKTIGTHIIFKTGNLKESIETLQQRGIIFSSPILEAPGFLKSICTSDPDGNLIEIAEYFRDPLLPQHS